MLVLEGEQHLWDIAPDGSRGEHRLYEILDADQNVVLDVTMEVLIEDWKANT